MSNLKFAAVIVIYNKKVQESITCKNLEKIKKDRIDIYIVDNSDKDYGNKNVCETMGYFFINMNGNKGLSKAYNRAIDNIIDQDAIVFLDDDTEVAKDYFDVLENSMMENESADIFAPIVYGQDGIIYSPNKFNFLRNKFIRDENEKIDQKDFNAIASCLAIRTRVFESYRFNEALFIDQVDQYFCYEQRQLNKKFVKMNVSIHQNFYQRGNKLDKKSGWRRMKLRLRDIMVHAKLMGGIKYKILGIVKNYCLSVQIGLKCKSFIVLLKGIGLSTLLIFKS